MIVYTTLRKRLRGARSVRAEREHVFTVGRNRRPTSSLTGQHNIIMRVENWPILTPPNLQRAWDDRDRVVYFHSRDGRRACKRAQTTPHNIYAAPRLNIAFSFNYERD